MYNSFANNRTEGPMSCGIPSTEHVRYGYRARILLYPYNKSESLAAIFPAHETDLKQLSFTQRLYNTYKIHLNSDAPKIAY